MDLEKSLIYLYLNLIFVTEMVKISSLIEEEPEFKWVQLVLVPTDIKTF